VARREPTARPGKPVVLWPVLDLYKGDNLFPSISIISSVLAQAGYRSMVVQADSATVGKALSASAGPVVLAFSTPTVYAPTYTELSRRLKTSFDFFSAFGGPHPTYFPDMIEAEGVDGICRGEGEYPLLDLLDRMSNGEPVAGIPNWWIKENGTIRRNPLRPLIQDLDDLPLPDHEIFRRAIPQSIWQAMVVTSRGCPYGCTYCYNHVYRKLYRGKGNVVRRRSVDHVIRELKPLTAYRCYRFVKFLDDLFTLSPDWIEEFSDKYSREIGLPFSCLVRANHLTPKIVRDLKKAGCWRVQLGLESGDDHVRNTIFKRGMDVEEIVEAARMVKAGGLKLVTGNILGAPGSSFEAEMKTLRLNMRIKPDYAGVSLLQPYPGTEIHEYAHEMHMLDSRSPTLTESTVSRFSTLTYTDEKEKDRTENLMKLFFLPIEFPWLLPTVKALIKAPANRVYHFVFSRWVDYCNYFRAIPPHVGRVSILKRSKLYFRVAGAWSRLRGPEGRAA
jgi:anaerobic magnesium-protoporphyrin IX monomethyl ester cyclase